jgi:CMP-N,N'-diacetyllegionaminic acid synthase
MAKIIALIPARKGSLRVKNKNIRNLGGHPMISYSIQSAINSKMFQSIIVASDSELICEIGNYYGATKSIKRNESDSSSTSLDIEWLKNLDNAGELNAEFFAILRPTSPLRSENLIKRCVDAFIDSKVDSLRTISKVTEHPGKMWKLGKNGVIHPYLKQNKFSHATHAMQYQSLEELFVQTSVLEIAKTSNIKSTESREGDIVMGYVTEGLESHSIDSEGDFEYLKYLISNNPKLLPVIDKPPIRFTE